VGQRAFIVRDRMGSLAALAMIMLIVSGCSHAISRPNRQAAVKGLTPQHILQDFDAYKGKLVLMGGEIIGTQNLATETVIEILQRPLDRHTGRPKTAQEYGGRFLVRYGTFKDPYVYNKGRELTVAGMVAGTKMSLIGEKAYTHLVLENRETYLWPEQKEYEGYPYDYPPWWYDPWWPYWYRRPYRY
jgi:outer membrane lipoprotein